MKKRILSGCILAASILVTTSCSDFLTENPQGKLTPENFFSNQAELDMSVYALYAKVQAFQCNSNPMIVQCQGDDVTSTTGSNKAAYLSADSFEAPSDVKGLRDCWNRLYTIIQAANLIVDNAANAKTNQEEINIALGQAHYWRAFSYFSLVRVFGALPINLHNTPDNNTTPLTTVEDVYALILKDLATAEKCNLPTKYTATNRSINGQNIYVSDQTVKATQAAVYMAMAGYPLNKTELYATAATKAKEVIDGVNSGKYPHGLLADYADVYSYGNNQHFETLLGIDYNSIPGGWSEGDSQLSSRLAQELREKNALVYGFGSNVELDDWVDSGALTIDANYTAGKSAQVSQGVRKVLNDLLTKGVTEQELEAAKANILKKRVTTLEDERNIHQMLTPQLERDRDLLFREKRDQALAKLTKADVDAVIKKYMKLDQLVEVMADQYGKKVN